MSISMTARTGEAAHNAMPAATIGIINDRSIAQPPYMRLGSKLSSMSRHWPKLSGGIR
jgi:hypothetical protein